MKPDTNRTSISRRTAVWVVLAIALIAIGSGPIAFADGGGGSVPPGGDNQDTTKMAPPQSSDTMEAVDGSTTEEDNSADLYWTLFMLLY